jgi:hypothetical protein
MGHTMLANPNYIEDEIRNGENQGYNGQSAQQKRSQMDRHSHNNESQNTVGIDTYTENGAGHNPISPPTIAGSGFTNNSVNVAGTNGVGANGGGGGIKDANGQDVIVDKEILEGLLDENQALKDEASKNKVVLDF